MCSAVSQVVYVLYNYIPQLWTCCIEKVRRATVVIWGRNTVVHKGINFFK